MGTHDGNNGVREFNTIENFRSDNRMDFHFFELFGSQVPRLGKNVLGDGELTDVVQHGGRANGVQLGFIQPEVLGNLDRIDLNPAQMIVGSVIFRLDRKGKRLDGPQMQSCNFFSVFLLRSESPQVGLIRAVDPINDGEGQKAKLPADQPIDGAYPTSNQRTKQIIGEGPQITFLPDVDGIASFGHGDDAGDGNGIEGEVG